ncbi:hypothetical protein PGB90_007955 [Kerria lacca]
MLLLHYSLGDENPKFPENTADISSINNLEHKAPITLDPKIRKALINVLNRLEQQESNQDKIEIVNNKTNQIRISDLNESPKDIKWEYKANDTFKEYNYYDTSNDSEKKSTLTNDEEITNEEPGALFFQIPESQETFEKNENLKLQETKNALSNVNLLSTNFGEETEKPKFKFPKLMVNETLKKDQINEKDVEVFRAPLLTAFTLEHDEQGLPRRIIPLEAPDLRSVFDNRIVPGNQDIRRIREQQVIQNPINIDSLFQQEQKRIRYNLESEFQELQERKRQIELENDRLLAEQEKARRLKFALEQRQKQQEYLKALNQNEIVRSEIALQKSIEPQFSFNLFNRQPTVLQPFSGPAFSRSLPPINFPNTVDRQLQHLFERSGLNQGRNEDLNIVSKILALNHEGVVEKLKNQEKRENDLRNIDLQNKRIIGLRTEHAQLFPQHVTVRD